MLAAALVLLPAILRAEDTPKDECGVPPELIQDAPQLPAAAARLAKKAPLTIAVIGGSSTVGNAAGSPDAAYPHQLEIALHKRYPAVPITVVNLGAPRQVARQMVQRFERDLAPAKPNLVLWEVGITDAVRQTDRDEFANTLQEGISWLREHQMEAMLIDMQFSAETNTVINFQPYLDTLHQVASLTDVYVFHRYEVMKYWVDNDVFNFTDVPQEQRKALAARVYACLGARLADAVAYAAR